MFRDPSNGPGEGLVVGSVQMVAAAPLEAIGKIATAIGSVTIMRADGARVRAGAGALVYQGDTIETGADGAVGITFIDGTAFNLSAASRLVLNEFSCECTGAPNSALFSLIQGAFNFVAGKVARASGLNIDTPFGKIRGTVQDRGIGILTLAALTFAAIKESQAASSQDAFLDDGTITYKDLPHGTFEITTRDGRVIIADDPGETIVVDPTGSVQRIPNSSSRMAELQQAQQTALATLSLGQQGAAPGGSSTQQFDLPAQLAPINFAQPSSGPLQEAVTTHVTAATSGFIEGTQFKPPVVVAGLAPDTGSHPVLEAINTTGSTHVDLALAGTLTFTLFNVSTVSASLASMTWSGGATPPSELAGVLAGALSVTIERADVGSGSIVTTFGAPDRNFDFLAANETLTVVYNVTAIDDGGNILTQPVTITITGTNDAPALTADASGPHTVIEGLGTTGTLTFTDVDVNDHHSVSTSVASATWSGGTTLPSGMASVLAGALSTAVSDSAGSGSGSIAVTFSAAAFDFLAAGQTLTITYNVTVTDNNGVSSTQPVTITVTGTNDTPVLAVDASGPHTITELAGKTGDIADNDTAVGSLSFTDVDLGDTHTVGNSLVSATWSGGGTLPSGLSTVLASALTTSVSSDSTGSGSGSVGVTFSAADHNFDFLAAGQTLTITYNVTVTDNNGVSSTQPVTITVTGTNDTPVLAVDASGPHVIIATPDTTGGDSPDSASGLLTFTDVDLTDAHQPSASAPTFAWSGGTLTAAQQAALAAASTLTLSETDSTGSGAGSIGFIYSAADKTFDFLAAGQTLTIIYNVTVTDNNGLSSTQPVTITVTGTNDAPVLAVDTSGPHTITELAGKTGDTVDNDTAVGSLSFTDVNLSDTHTVGNNLVSATWSGGATLPSGLSTVLASALTTSVSSDSTGSGFGSVAVTFSAADHNFDFLAAGQTLTITYNVTVTDSTGASSTQPVTITVTGTDDVPVITAQDLIGAVTEQITPAGNLTDSGTITFTDVDLSDVHLVSATGTPIGSVLGTLTVVKNTDTTGTGTGGQLTWTYTVAASAVEFLAAGQTKVESFTITLDDQHGGLITRQIDVTITGTNDVPVITAQDLIGAVTEQITPAGNLTDSGTITFSDVDLTDVHLVSATGTPIGSVLGTLTVVKNTDTTGTGTGGQLTWTYTVADSAVEFLAAGQTKVESFTITLDDQHGGLITRQIDVTITGTNDVPVITAQDLAGAVTEQITPAGNLTDSGTITFNDVDLTDMHLVSATGTPIGSVLGTLMVVKNTDTTGTGTGGQLTWTYTVADSAVEYLAAGQTKVESFTITLDDQHGGLITRQIDVTITGTNDVPVITAQDLIGAVTEQITPAGNLTDSGTITFTDVDLTDVHLVSATGTPIGSVLGTLTVVKNTDTTGTGTGGQLTWTYTVAASAVEFLTAGQTKVESFTITLNDQHGGLITRQIDVTITGTADARVIAPGEVLTLSGETVTDPLIQNNGTILVQSNNQSTVLGSIITGTGPGGAIEIKNNSTLQIDGSVDSGQTVLFSVDPGGGANAKLILTDPLNFHGKISDFSGNDQIDLGNFVVSSITYVDNAGTNTGGTLKVFGIFNGNGIVTEVDIIFIDGDKTTLNFSFASDGNNGTTIIDPPTSTTTPEATVIPVVDSSTLTATETAGSQTDVSSATADDGTVAALGASVSDPDGGEATNVTDNKSGAAAHTARIVSGPGSLMVNPGVAPEFTSLSHKVAGNLTDHATVEVSNPPDLARTALSRDRGAVNVLEGQIALASVMLVLQFLTESFKLASDANAGTLIADPPASPDAEVAAVSETRAVKAADTADTQATAAAADEGAVAVLDATFAPDGGMLDLASSGLPADFVLPESDGDEPTATHDAISLAYSEFADHGLHGSGKEHTTAPNVATTNSAEGRVSLSSHTTSSETGSDGNSHGGDAVRIHDAISTIDTVGTTISDSASSSFRGATSGHVNDQPHFENASPGTLQSLESPTQGALHAHEGRPDHNHGAAPEHGATIDTPATTIADSGVPGLRGEPPGHVNDKVNDKAQLGNADPGNNGLGHQSHDLPSRAAARAVDDSPTVAAVEDTKGARADHSHGAAAEHSRTDDTPATTIADSDAWGLRGEPPGHVNDKVNDKAQLGNADPGNNGLGHQSHELRGQAAARAVDDSPTVAAVEDTKGARADHSHGAAAEHSRTDDTPATTIADSDAPGLRGEPPGHVNDKVNDKAQLGNADPGNNGLGHQSGELPNQTASHAAVEDAKGGHAADTHGAAAEHSQTIDTPATTIAESDAPGFRGEAPGHVNDQPQVGNADPRKNGLGHQSDELPNQAASHAAVEDGKGDHAAHGQAGADSPTIDTPATTLADREAPGLRGEPPGHGNDQPQVGNADPRNNGLGHQSDELPNQAASHAAVEDGKGDHAAHGQAGADSPTIDTAGTTVAETDSSGFQGAAPDQFHFAYTNPGTSQSTELPSQAASDAAVEIPASTTDNNGVGHGNDLNAAALPNAVDDAKGGDKAQIRDAAAKDSSTTDVAGVTTAGNHSSSFQDAASGIMNDQFHFADANPGNKGLGQQSLELASQAVSQPAVDVPAATTELAQIIDQVLTEAAQAPQDPGTTPEQNPQLPWTNLNQHDRSSDFITHA